MKIEDVRQAVTDLEKKGLNPIDLFSWVYLLDLHARYKSFEGIDLDIHYQMQMDIEKALWRKAKMLDEEKKTTFHTEMLESMGLVSVKVA